MSHLVARTGHYSTAIGGMLPIGLTYRGEGLYVRVRYAGSPLLGADPGGRDYVAGAAAAYAAARVSDEEDQAYDDD